MSSIQVLGKALRILEVLAAEKIGVSLGFLSKRLDLPRSTVQRIIDTLVEEGWVQKGENNGELRLGFKSMRLGLLVAPGTQDYLQQLVKRLNERSRETVTVAHLVDNKIQVLTALESKELLKASAIRQDQIPLLDSSLGKVLLAFVPEAQKDFDLSPAYLNELETVRQEGLAFDREACAPGLCSVAIHLALPGQEPLALAIVAPAVRYYQQETVFVEMLRELARLE